MHQLCVLKNIKDNDQISCEFCDTVTKLVVTHTYWIVILLSCLYSHIVGIAEVIFCIIYVFPHESPRIVPIAIDIFMTTNAVLLLLEFCVTSYFNHIITTFRHISDASLLFWLFIIAICCGTEGAQLSNVSGSHQFIILMLCLHVVRFLIFLWPYIVFGIRFLCYDVRAKEN